MVTVTQPEISKITAESLGSQQFKEDYGIRYAYITGSMYKGYVGLERPVPKDLILEFR